MVTPYKYLIKKKNYMNYVNEYLKCGMIIEIVIQKVIKERKPTNIDLQPYFLHQEAGWQLSVRMASGGWVVSSP